MEPDWQPALIDTYLACKRRSYFQQTTIILNDVDTIFEETQQPILVIAVHLCNPPLNIKVKNIQNPAQKTVWPLELMIRSTLTPIWQQSHGMKWTTLAETERRTKFRCQRNERLCKIN